ncbi:MAG: hypothetical protein H6736_13490 [Alphaproteobacteria bacterium]|nr:hypothetical protein [Alphaproteobacteria bacterium]MCB9692818.1 hypothetical protein [Alphaproteobacteria bacterium]
MIWSGVLVPLFGANTQDGFGLGFGGEVFTRPRWQMEGYKLKITTTLWVTTNLGYTSDWFQVDRRGDTDWLGRAGFRGWSNHAFVGVGGDRVELVQSPREVGNVVYGPFAFLGISRPVTFHDSLFAQANYKTYFVEAGPDGFLALLRPHGVDGGTYVDFTLGVEHDTTDRWPMPHRGVRAETSARVGISAMRGDHLSGLVGANAEAIGWYPVGSHLVVAGRFVVDKTVGRRPFFETDTGGGRWRDELGSEQAFSGYGRTRTRGDGMVAGMVEVRPYFFRTNHSFLDLEFHGSVFAEQGWLTQGWDAGPPLPTVGFAPEVLFQGAIQCRPFLAWGWRREPGAVRREPVSQFGISFVDPL